MSYYSKIPQPVNGQRPPQPAALMKSPSSSEVLPKPKRRTFSAEYKRRILREADQCTQRGEVGALLRREALYSSHLTDWRRQAAAGQLGGNKRGRKPLQSQAQKEQAQLQRENDRLRKQLAQAEKIIDAQKKVAALLDYINQTTDDQR